MGGLLWLLSLLAIARAASTSPPPIPDCFNRTSLPYRTTGARLNVQSYETSINTIESAMMTCLLDQNCVSIGEDVNMIQHRFTLHGPGTLFPDPSMRTHLRLSACTRPSPPSPPPQPPAVPSPTFSCNDLAGRVNARDLTHARWCFQLSRASLTCADYYAKGTGNYHVCYDPGEGRFCADASNQLQCTLLPPSPPPLLPPPPPPPSLSSPPPSPQDTENASTVPECTDAQDAHNFAYCYSSAHADENPLMCSVDNSIYCAERCGLCMRKYAVGPNSFRIHVELEVASFEHELNRVSLKKAVSDALSVSINQIELTIALPLVNQKIGITQQRVEMLIATYYGTEADAAALQMTINTMLSDTTTAATLLNIPVLSIMTTMTTRAAVLNDLPAAPPAALLPGQRIGL